MKATIPKEHGGRYIYIYIYSAVFLRDSCLFFLHTMHEFNEHRDRTDQQTYFYSTHCALNSSSRVCPACIPV